MKLDKKNLLFIAFTAFLLFLAMRYWGYAENAFFALSGAASPLIIGFIAAYILNILMSFYEKHYFVKSKKAFVKKSRRPFCLVMAVVTLLAIVSLLIKLVVPELVRCVQMMAREIPPFMERIADNEYISKILPQTFVHTIDAINWKEYLSNIVGILTSGITNAAETVYVAVTKVFSTVITGFVSIIFTVYFLFGKENLKKQWMRFMNVYLPKKWNEKIIYVLSVLNDSFHRYIVGQCIEAVILGVLCIIGMAIFRFPYAIMIGTLVGFSALIPIAGAYIGAVVGAIMMLTVSWVKALLFIIFIILLQQIEGNLIYPRVVGKSIGLPAVYVLAAIIIGGGLFGIGGMLIGVPLTSAVYRMISNDIKKHEI